MKKPKSGAARLFTANDLFAKGEHIAALVILADVLATHPDMWPKSRNSILAKMAEISADLTNQERLTPMRTVNTITPIDPADLSASDLRAAAADDPNAQAWSIDHDLGGDSIAAIYLPSVGRMGITWGADAEWADWDNDIEGAIDCSLNDPDRWSAAN